VGFKGNAAHQFTFDHNEAPAHCSRAGLRGDAEFAGVENAGVKIAGKGKLWKANILTICC